MIFKLYNNNTGAFCKIKKSCYNNNFEIDNQNICTALTKPSNFLLIKEDAQWCYKMLKIQNAIVLIKEDSFLPNICYSEINDDMVIFSSKNAHWNCIEIELRFNTHTDPSSIIKSLHTVSHSAFIFSRSINPSVSKEQYFRLSYLNSVCYYDIIKSNKLEGFPENLKYTSSLSANFIKKNID